MTCGNTEVRFWNKNKGRMGKLTGKWEPMYSALYIKNCYITGSGSGNIFVWVGNAAGKGIKAHQGKIHCFQQYHDGFLSGGDDGFIKLWNLKGGTVV